MPRRGGGGGTAGGGKRGSAINVSKPSDPAFLKRFKEQAGYKEKVVTIDDKVSLAGFELFEFLALISVLL